ncbi:short-chain dehydrogenase [Pseudomonas sp. 7P_10.2_Bac1]|uniref:short-chain dehydrogenase n=1 Tax=Pseudomonas sp. 7P_10.2_Bac1 TaxID=2971614 RepID=UPI0021C97CC4|nr:short-chain dehydrogenase [Pseudomonas sp. 7P_10.2_Bac1]MCU1728955.1 short-chain dehydrogenase [Pseudomonas sp. 7P_10.2_Bac1]
MSTTFPMTAIDCLIPCMLIDTQTPPDVIHANAAARILAVTHLLESVSRLDGVNADGIDLKHITQAAALLLRDGCDLMDALGRRLQV